MNAERKPKHSMVVVIRTQKWWCTVHAYTLFFMWLNENEYTRVFNNIMYPGKLIFPKYSYLNSSYCVHL